MQGNAHHAGCWRTGAALVTVAIVAGCSIYQPLDRGSSVPWAKAHVAGSGLASGDKVIAEPEVVVGSGERYRVRPGDRLGDLARSYGVKVADLAQVNDLEAPYIIRVGQDLRIPARAPAAGPGLTVVASRAVRSQEVAPIRVSQHVPAHKIAAEPQKVAALEVAVAPSAKAQPAPRLKPQSMASLAPGAGASAARYTVRSGESLSEIAARLNVGMTDLARANRIGKPYRLYAGQKLQVPARDAPETTMVQLGKQHGSVRLATGDPPPLKGDDFLWPVNGKVIGAFGPIDQGRRRDGIDIAARRGAPVLAAQDGIVAFAGDGIRGYGQMILLRHDQGYITTYAHNATLLVDVGDVVQRGQVIARVGDTGDATQTMLHFELRKGRTPVDPETRLVSDTTTMASTLD